jgi:glutaredoxin 3
MKTVEIYTSPLCGFCHRAKALLSGKGIPFTEINVLGAPAKKAEMVQRADGRSTVPQVFIGGTGIGGSDELAALDRAGKLDALLAA